MEAPRISCVISIADGPSRRVGPGGLVIGRQGDCDIVVADPSVSRRHALIQLTSDGAVITALGRAPLEINGKKCERTQPLSHGDTLALPGVTLSIELEAHRPSAAAGTYRLLLEGGSSFGLSHSPFVIGGDKTDDLIIKRWPAHALRFHQAQGDLYLELVTGKATLNDTPVETGTMEPLSVGDRVGYKREVLVVMAEASHGTTTVLRASDLLPTKVVVELLARGGRVVFTLPDGDRSVYLADRRLDLLVALLQPPAGFAPGDFIPDDAVRAIVWPRNPGVTRPEINMLISRCRKDLVEAGLAGSRLIERSPGGGATRLTLSAGAEVSVQS
jgi:FHA domain